MCADPVSVVSRGMCKEFRELTLAAVAAWRTLALAYASTGGYMPRERLPQLKTFHTGWPNITSAAFSDTDGQPRDLAALVGSKKDLLHPYGYGDIPELVTLFEFVEADPALSDMFVWRGPDGSPLGDDARRTQFVRTGVGILVGSIVARADAFGVADDSRDRDLFQERYRAMTDETLPAELVVPLLVIDFEFPGARFDLGEGVWLERLDERTQLARAPSQYSIYGVPGVLAGAAVVAVVVAGVELDNRNHSWRFSASITDQLPLGVVERVCEALRLITHHPIGYAQVLVRPVGWADLWKHDLPPITEVDQVRRYAASLDRYGWLGPYRTVPAEAVNRAPELFTALAGTEPNVLLAAKRLSRAALSAEDDDIVLDACIGIEALLGDNKTELTHRICLRCAAALADLGTDPIRIYQSCKKVYDYRSAVAHGTTVKPAQRTIKVGESTVPTPVAATLFLRRLLISKLTVRPTWSPQSLDELLLTRLVPPPAPDQTASS